MPVTAVFQQPAGQLEQLQIGAADIVATIAAAHSAWGWIGGISGISSILGLCQRKSDTIKIERLFKCISLDNASCHILSQKGLQAVGLANSGEAFGETIASKLVGTTMCALAHNMSPEGAIGLFMKYFIDGLFKKGLSDYPGSRETFATFLHDNYQAILNEGATHRLGDRFDTVITELGAVYGLKFSYDPRFKGDAARRGSETQFIEGFLRWLIKADPGTPYYTRSAIVGRVAASLRCIGYKIGNIVVWNGTGKRPCPPRGLVVVTGGSSDTDELNYDVDGGSPAVSIISHYHWNTVGAMFWNAFDQEFPNSYHESFQQDFNDIDAGITQALEMFQWSYVDTSMENVQAFPIWSHQPRTASRIAVSLATVFFRNSVDQLAPYYEVIATEQCLKQVKERSWGLADYGIIRQANENLSAELQRFLVITGSICISVLGQISGDNFKNLRHSSIEPIFSMQHFRRLCHDVDTILNGGCEMSKVIRAVAAIHCAVDLSLGRMSYMEGEEHLEQGGSLIGWRNGRYAVLPNLLFQLSTSLKPSVLDLHCTDVFIANLAIRRDGAIHCKLGGVGALGFTSEPFKPWQDESRFQDIEKADSGSEGPNPIVLGRPHVQAPDKPLYVSIERPPYATNFPEISLCGRVSGESVGNVTIQDVLKTLALSWSDSDGFYYSICDAGAQHISKTDDNEKQFLANVVYNMPASRYCEQIDIIPRADEEKEHGGHCVYIQVAEDTPWTLFLAGQSPLHNRVAFGCAECAVRTGHNCIAKGLQFMSIIGYQ